MQSTIILTLTGPDRVGIVEEVTGALLKLGANVETSRMARLGGDFAILMLVSLSAEQLANLEPAFEYLADQGYKLTTSQTEQLPSAIRTRCLAYRIDVTGADHEGIVHDIAHGLSQKGINIESMETSTSPAPVSGTPLFSMTTVVAVPPELAEKDWQSALSEAGHQANVDVAATRLGEDEPAL